MPICECAEFPISLDLRLQKYKNAHKEHLQYLCGYMKSKNKVNTKASKKRKTKLSFQMTKTPMEGTAFCKLFSANCKIMNCNTVLPTEKKIQHYSLVKSILNFYAVNENFWGV